MTSASTAAAYIIWYSHEHGEPISNLKLQKLLYYAQAWRLALTGDPLFGETIEAWVHGPVVPPVYGEYKEWSWQPIMTEPARPEMEAPDLEHMDEVMDVYGGFTAIDLEKMTHAEDPWRIARGDLPADAASHNEIKHSDMRDFYRKRLEPAENKAG